jgi:hypothetical protein
MIEPGSNVRYMFLMYSKELPRDLHSKMWLACGETMER